MRKAKEVHFYIPQTYNGGLCVSEEDLRYIKEGITRIFGGFTCYPNLVGGWLPPNGDPKCEPVMIMTVVVRDSPHFPECVQQLGMIIRERLAQVEVFIIIHDVVLHTATASVVSSRSNGSQNSGRSFAPGLNVLSPREQEVLARLLKGLKTKDIATVLVISERTAWNHIQNIYVKLGVRTKVELFLWALRNGLIDLEN